VMAEGKKEKPAKPSPRADAPPQSAAKFVEPLADLPPLHTGAVGYLGYDTVRYIERLPKRPPDDRRLPEMLWLFVGALAAFDRFEQTITLVRNVYIGKDPGAQYDEAVDYLATYVEKLGAERAHRVVEAYSRGGAFIPPKTRSTLEQAEFEAAVAVAKRHIRAGDAYQIVLSQRLETEFTGEPFSIYRALRVISPSPFLFYVRHPEVTVIGSSPELMTRVRAGVVYSRPVAGTRPRGATPTMVAPAPLIVTTRPTTSGSEANRRRHSR